MMTSDVLPSNTRQTEKAGDIMSSPEVNGTAPSLTDAINKLMANPEIISTVASALGNIGTQEKTAESSNGIADIDGEKDAQSDIRPDIGELMKGLAPVLSTIKGSSPSSKTKNAESDRREALLCALKPYVSEGRREAIDYIIRISQVSDILKNIQR